jgi:hypothetical protein
MEGWTQARCREEACLARIKTGTCWMPCQTATFLREKVTKYRYKTSTSIPRHGSSAPRPSHTPTREAESPAPPPPAEAARPARRYPGRLDPEHYSASVPRTRLRTQGLNSHGIQILAQGWLPGHIASLRMLLCRTDSSHPPFARVTPFHPEPFFLTNTMSSLTTPPPSDRNPSRL